MLPGGKPSHCHVTQGSQQKHLPLKQKFQLFWIETVFLFLTYQITKESTRYGYHAKQESCFARWQVKQSLHDFWHERCCSCESKILQADTQCDEYERKSWQHKFCCFGKIFQLGVACFFSSILCHFVFFRLGENTRNFLFELLISSKEIYYLMCNAFKKIPWKNSRVTCEEWYFIEQLKKVLPTYFMFYLFHTMLQQIQRPMQHNLFDIRAAHDGI